LLLGLSAPLAAASEITERLRLRLESLEPGRLIADGEVIYAAEPLRAVYDRRGYTPIWFTQKAPRPLLRQLPELLQLAAREGLVPADYHLAALQRGLQRLQGRADARVAVDVELQATDALLTLAAHFQHGKVVPTTIDPEWFLPLSAAQESTPLIEAVLRNDREGLLADLTARLPQTPAYAALRERLAMQTQLAQTDWPRLPGGGRALRQGDRDARVVALRQRLLTLGDHAQTPGTDETFDAALHEAVLAFQRRHGLDADGIVGAGTLAALNVTPAERIAQLRVNMARWRWLPRDLGTEYILVNIAGFSMDVVAQGETVMRQRVIVGRPYRQTPVFSGRMTYLVLNPSWEVPQSLASKDLLPQIQADSAFVERMGFSVLQGWGAQERSIDPASVNWSNVSATRFPYRLRQKPGPLNALGRVKFMFPNEHNVYLHDTSAPSLFAKEGRAFSSGCIRVSDPQALTNWLLHGPNRPVAMSPDKIRQTLDQGQETTVRLGRAVPVHLLYWTAWVDEDARVQYRPDIYTRDAALLQALDAPPPTL
ncbi:MAG: L,D-transpeptidase family protein, partial [Oceanococcaceae bacterium]